MPIKPHLIASMAAIVLASLTMAAPPALAQDPVADLRRELEALRAEVKELRAEVQTLKSGGEAATPAAVEILRTQVAELAQTKVESTSRFPVKLFGTIHASAFANSDTANWLDNPNLVGPPPADGHPGTTSLSLRQTRLGFTADGPTIGSARTSGVVAMDFFGGVPAFQTGQVMGLPRLLVAYARIENDRTALEVGQDHVILAPRDPTSLAAFAFPLLFRSGNLYLRAPQVRVEHSIAGNVRAAAGVIAPIGGDFTSVDYLFVPPALGGERSRRPGVQARVAYTSDGGGTGAMRSLDVGVSGHVGWERQATDLSTGWATAVDFAARRDMFGVAGEAFIGDNVDAFGGALGLDARSAGGWAELQLFPTERLSFTAGFGLDDIRDRARSTLPRQSNKSSYGNVMFSFTPEVQASFEYRWLRTLSLAGPQSNHHVDGVLVYKF
jgi:hypothetical protein